MSLSFYSDAKIPQKPKVSPFLVKPFSPGRTTIAMRIVNKSLEPLCSADVVFGSFVIGPNLKQKRSMESHFQANQGRTGLMEFGFEPVCDQL